MSSRIPQSIARYQIVRALGEGGMGSVYLAKDPAIDRFVAIKLLRSGFDDDTARERFRREAKAVGQLHHINIVTIFDVGEHEGDPFIAMEYVEGQTIAQIVRSGAEIPLVNALNWMDGLCAGLHYAHRRGIIHRDIKPANLVVDEENKVKILDFGIARGPAAGMTQVGMLMGTLNYMSPEQLSGRTLDHRSDIFAVGGVFYELLTGKQAFPGDINSGVLHKILMGQPDPVRQLNASIGEEVGTIVERCLAKEPDARYGDLDAMRKDLARVRARHEDLGAETTIRLARGTGDVQGARLGRTPGEKTRAELLRQRRERIVQQLTRAREALASRDLATAADACHQALILDPENGEAFELQDRVEHYEQAQKWLDEAKSEIARGALTGALALLGRAAEYDPELSETAPLREQVTAERQRRDEERRRREEEQRRAEAVAAAVARVRAALGRDDIAGASAALADARGIDAAHPEVLALAKAIAERAAEIKRAQEDARAQAAVADARRRFAAGEHQPAIAMLVAYTPPHPLIAEARAALEFEHGEILRREAEERRRLEAKKREEEARRKEEERRRQEEERRKAEEARRKAEAEALERKREDDRRQAEARKREEDAKRRQEEERKAADARAHEEAARKAAEERQRREAEERRNAEEARRKAEEAARAAREQAAAAARRAAADEDTEKTVVMFPPADVQAQAKQVRERTTVPPAPTPAPPSPAGSSASTAAAPPSPPPPVSLADVSGGGAASSALDLPGARPIADEIEPVQRWPWSSKPAIYGAAAAVVVVVAALVWWLTRPPIVPSPVAVLIDIRPWAAVQAVTDTSGQAVSVACPATPCVVSLPPGEYHVRAQNPFFPNALEFEMKVTGSEYQTVRQTLPDFNAEDEARRILGGR